MTWEKNAILNLISCPFLSVPFWVGVSRLTKRNCESRVKVQNLVSALDGRDKIYTMLLTPSQQWAKNKKLMTLFINFHKKNQRKRNLGDVVLIQMDQLSVTPKQIKWTNGEESRKKGGKIQVFSSCFVWFDQIKCEQEIADTRKEFLVLIKRSKIWGKRQSGLTSDCCALCEQKVNWARNELG